MTFIGVNLIFIEDIRKAVNYAITEFFRAAEFRCPCCNVTKVAVLLVKLLTELRKDLGVGIRIISGYRCVNHNSSLGNSNKNSKHIKGFAADIVTVGRKYPALAAFMLATKYFKRIGFYLTADRKHASMHVDILDKPTYWVWTREDGYKYFSKPEEVVQYVTGNGWGDALI